MKIVLVVFSGVGVVCLGGEDSIGDVDESDVDEDSVGGFWDVDVVDEDSIGDVDKNSVGSVIVGAVGGARMMCKCRWFRR